MPLPDLDTINFQILCACFTAWFCFYSWFLLAVEVTNLFVLILLLSFPVASFYIEKIFALAQPPEAVIVEVLGEDPRKVPDDLPPDEIKDCLEGKTLIKVYAHRFAGLDAPENSLSALETCVHEGSTAVEFDVVLTKDLVPVIFHDCNLDRMTNVIGDIQKKTWEEIKSLDISVNHPFHERFAGTTIPLFSDVLQKCLEADVRMIIDIKDTRQEMTDTICSAYEKYPKLYKRAIVSSFYPQIIYNIRARLPQVVASLAWRPKYISCCKYTAQDEEEHFDFLPFQYLARWGDYVFDWFFFHISYHLVGASAVLLFKDTVTAEVINMWAERGLRVMAWTVNLPAEKIFFSRVLKIPYITDTMSGN